MKDCHSDMLAFHNDRVTLNSVDRTEMRDRRNANRTRLVSGLARDEEPPPDRMQSQGSYAMRTMVQQPDKDYDIDDGVYFTKEDLKGPRGGDRTPADAKEMVRKAVHDDQFATPPEVRQNCVRVYYQAGYHVDLPVYRIVMDDDEAGSTAEEFELASTEWKTSDPSSVTGWFIDANKAKSPTTTNGGQMRRITRLLKLFARSRPSWKGRIASGFVITKLVDEQYRADESREDGSLHTTMTALRDRLQTNLEVEHPTISAEKLTNGPDDASTRFLREKLEEALNTLDILFDADCGQGDAHAAWDKVFNTDFFGKRSGEDGDNGGGGKGLSAAILIKGAEDRAVQDAVDKRGGGRYA